MDAIFKALNDPARRTLLDSLRQKDGQSLQELENQLEMTRFGVMKHLRVLSDAHLVTSRKVGRFKYHYLNALPLQEVIDRWIEPLLAKPTAQGMIKLKSELESTAPMTKQDEKPDFISETFIKTDQDALWEALTSSDIMAQYHFACKTVEGDAIEGKTTDFMRPDGSKMLSQRTLKIDPKSRLEMTFEPHFFGPDAPASRVVYSVEAQGPLCKLTCEHYGIPDGQDGVCEGWARWSSSLKSFLETGEGLQMAA